MPLPFGKTNAERVDIMTQAGVTLARSKDIGDVQTVYYVTEAWVSPARKSFTMPSEDPDRISALVFSALDARTNIQELEMYACVRNWKQDIVELKLVPQPQGQMEVGGQLLPSFLSGFKLFKR